MILDFDIGNTRLKWRVSTSAGTVLSTGAVVHNQNLDVANLLPELRRVSRVRIVSVMGRVESQIKELCATRWGVSPQVASVIDGCGGVVCGYESPSRLGVDRWLAVIAAWARHRRACLVVSAGSALTVDIVNDVGHHQGGYIVPGLWMMAQALGSNTWGIEVDASVTPALAPGATTSEAVMHGCLMAVVGAIERIAAGERINKVFITGGDAALVARSLSIQCDVEVVPGLVLDGLTVALP